MPESTYITDRRRRLRVAVMVPAAILGLTFGSYAEVSRGFVADSSIPYGMTFAVPVIGSTVLGYLVYRIALVLLAGRHERAARLLYGADAQDGDLTQAAVACVICNRPAKGTFRCPRCEAPVCIEHAAKADECCSECERDFQQRLGDAVLWPWVVALFGIPWTVFALAAPHILDRYPSSGGYRVMTTGLPILDAAIMTLVASMFLVGAGLELRRLVMRRRFLREVTKSQAGEMARRA